MLVQEGKKIKPKKSLNQLQKLSFQKLMLSDYLDYCYHIITRFQNSKRNQLDTNLIYKLNFEPKTKVISEYRPCLIYQHLSETFSSLVQAFQDKDQILVQEEIKQIRQSIQSFWLRDDLPEYKDYQCMFDYEVDQNNVDTLIRQKFLNTFQMLISLYTDSSTTSKFNPSTFPGSNKNNIQKRVEKQAKLKKRLQQKVNPKLQRILKNMVFQSQSEVETKQNHNFILSYGVNFYK